MLCAKLALVLVLLGKLHALGIPPGSHKIAGPRCALPTLAAVVADALPPPLLDAPLRQRRPLVLLVMTLPPMGARLYEAALRKELSDRGEIVRWYISNIDSATRYATAEVVLLPHATEVALQ